MYLSLSLSLPVCVCVCVCVCSYIVARAMRMPMGPATLLSVCRSDWATSALRRVNSMSQLSMGMQLIRGTPRISLDQSAAHGAYSNYSTRGHRHTDRERERERERDRQGETQGIDGV